MFNAHGMELSLGELNDGDRYEPMTIQSRRQFSQLANTNDGKNRLLGKVAPIGDMVVETCQYWHIGGGDKSPPFNVIDGRLVPDVRQVEVAYFGDNARKRRQGIPVPHKRLFDMQAAGAIPVHQFIGHPPKGHKGKGRFAREQWQEWARQLCSPDIIREIEAHCQQSPVVMAAVKESGPVRVIRFDRWTVESIAAKLIERLKTSERRNPTSYESKELKRHLDAVAKEIKALVDALAGPDKCGTVEAEKPSFDIGELSSRQALEFSKSANAEALSAAIESERSGKGRVTVIKHLEAALNRLT